MGNGPNYYANGGGEEAWGEDYHNYNYDDYDGYDCNCNESYIGNLIMMLETCDRGSRDDNLKTTRQNSADDWTLVGKNAKRGDRRADATLEMVKPQTILKCYVAMMEAMVMMMVMLELATTTTTTIRPTRQNGRQYKGDPKRTNDSEQEEHETGKVAMIALEHGLATRLSEMQQLSCSHARQIGLQSTQRPRPQTTMTKTTCDAIRLTTSTTKGVNVCGGLGMYGAEGGVLAAKGPTLQEWNKYGKAMARLAAAACCNSSNAHGNVSNDKMSDSTCANDGNHNYIIATPTNITLVTQLHHPPIEFSSVQPHAWQPCGDTARVGWNPSSEGSPTARLLEVPRACQQAPAGRSLCCRFRGRSAAYPKGTGGTGLPGSPRRTSVPPSGQTDIYATS